MASKTTAETAIARSVSHNEIVTIEGDESVREELSLAADDSVKNGPVTEYWGTDDEGNEWRVHVEN